MTGAAGPSRRPWSRPAAWRSTGRRCSPPGRRRRRWRTPPAPRQPAASSLTSTRRRRPVVAPISSATARAPATSRSASTTAARPRPGGRRWPARCPDAAPVTKAARPASGSGGAGAAWPPPAPSTRCGTSRPRRSGVGRDRLGAPHDVDGVDVELARDAGGPGVGAEAEHADAGDQDDHRVGAPHGRRVGRGSGRSRRRSRRGRRRAAPAPLTRSSTGAVGGRSSSSGRADEVVGARGPERGQPRDGLT